MEAQVLFKCFSKLRIQGAHGNVQMHRAFHMRPNAGKTNPDLMKGVMAANDEKFPVYVWAVAQK